MPLNFFVLSYWAWNYAVITNCIKSVVDDISFKSLEIRFSNLHCSHSLGHRLNYFSILWICISQASQEELLEVCVKKWNRKWKRKRKCKWKCKWKRKWKHKWKHKWKPTAYDQHTNKWESWKYNIRANTSRTNSAGGLAYPRCLFE